MEPEVIPAILAKDRADLLRRINLVIPHVKEIQLDIMDGKFVPNTTIGLKELAGLPAARYEFHWMVLEPERYIAAMPGPHMHLVHVETIRSIDAIEAAVRKSGGSLGFAINPETPLEKLIPLLSKARRVLVMTVHPGFSGQKYLYEMEGKIRALRKLCPALDIEVDGGVNEETIGHAYSCGANKLAAASALFNAADIGVALKKLKRLALEGLKA